MYYAKLVDGKATRCNLADELPFEVMTSNFTEEQLNSYGVIIVNDAPSLPEHNPETHGLVDDQPVQGSDGKWYATYIVVEKAPEAPAPEMPV